MMQSAENQISVSIIMPVFNASRFLTESIESVLNQSFTDFEFIIIEDGSTDSSLQIVSQYASKDRRIRIVCHSDNLGITEALNNGLVQTRGRYIARMDADDISMPDRFAKQINYMDLHPEIALLGTAVEYIDESGNVLGVGNVISGWPLIKEIAPLRTPSPHPTWLFRREILDKVRGYRINGPAQDYDFLLRLITSGYKIDNLPNVFLKLRYSASNTMSRRALEQQKANYYVLHLYNQRIRNGYDQFSNEAFENAIRTPVLLRILHNISLIPYRAALKFRLREKTFRALILFLLSAIVSPYQLRNIYRGYKSSRIIKKWRLSNV